MGGGGGAGGRQAGGGGRRERRGAWRRGPRHYTQKLQDWPGWTERAVNPVFRRLNWDSRDEALIDAWKRGETGYPMVDASMRCLRATGWLNFRMRAMCASFFGYVLEQPWRVGADYFYEHLIDGDPAGNYTPVSFIHLTLPTPPSSLIPVGGAASTKKKHTIVHVAYRC